MGEQGYKVKIVNTPDEASEALHSFSKEDFLLQEHVAAPREGSLFYYRLPKEAEGRLVSMVRKIYPQVTGDGVCSAGALLKKDPKKSSYAKACQALFPERMAHIPRKGEVYTLHSVGAHRLGTRIVDESHCITPALGAFVDGIMKKIEGFYYGRIDVKYHTYADVLAGGYFKIMEVNGITSIPLQVYSEGYTYARTLSEFKKHISILSEISRQHQEMRGRTSNLRLTYKNTAELFSFFMRQRPGL